MKMNFDSENEWSCLERASVDISKIKIETYQEYITIMKSGEFINVVGVDPLNPDLKIVSSGGIKA